MKSAATCIALIAILSCFFLAQATSKPQQPDIPVAWTSLVAWRIASPQPVLCTDDKIHLVYELLVMNVSASAMMLDRLETLDACKDDAGSNTKSGDAIVAMLQGANLEATIRAFPTGSTRTIGPFQLTRIFLDVKFAKDATLPKVLTHRFQVTFAPATGTSPTPPNFPKGYDLLQQLGNFVIIDIGYGHFAFYAHFQPNTLKVHVGDKVRRGQVLALMGNSGNSGAPHLPFGIQNGPLPYASDSLPFVFSSFTITGTITNSFDDIAAGGTAQIGSARAGPHRNELPLQDEVITFPKQ